MSFDKEMKAAFLKKLGNAPVADEIYNTVVALFQELEATRKQRDDALAELEAVKLHARRMDRELCDCCQGTGRYQGEECPECGDYDGSAPFLEED